MSSRMERRYAQIMTASPAYCASTVTVSTRCHLSRYTISATHTPTSARLSSSLATLSAVKGIRAH